MKSRWNRAAAGLLAVASAACQPRIAPLGAGTTPIQGQPTGPATVLAATATPDSDIITPERVGRLAEVGLLGMGRPIGTPVYSPDGRWLFLPTSTGVYRYDTTSYLPIQILVSWGLGIGRDAFVDISSDGKTLVAAAMVVLRGSRSAQSVHLIDLEDGHELAAPDVAPDFGQRLLGGAELSPGGSWLALVLDGRGPVGVWRAADGEPIYRFQGDAVEFSADDRLMTLHDDGRVALVDLQTGDVLRDWPGDASAFLPGNRLVVESDGSVRVFDLATGKARQAFDGRFAAFSPDGDLLALISMGQLRILRVADGQLLATMEDRDRDLWDPDQATLRFAPDGRSVAAYWYRLLCCGGYQAYLSLWRVADGGLLSRLLGDQASPLFGFAPDGRALAVVHYPVTSEVWNVLDGSSLASLGGFGQTADFAFSPDGNHAFVSVGAADGGWLLDYEVDSGQLSGREDAAAAGPVAFSPDGTIGAQGSRVWRVPDGQPLEALSQSIGGELPDPSRLAISADSQKLAVGGAGGFQIWDLVGQQMLLEEKACSLAVESLSFSVDGQRLAVACGDMMGGGEPNVQVWEALRGGRLLMELDTKSYGIWDVAYSPDGTLVAAAGGYTYLWSSSTGELLSNIGVAYVRRLAFSPDGQILALGLQDGSVELWGVANRQRVGSLLETQESSPVTTLAFSPDGKLLAVGHENSSIIMLFGVHS